MNHQKSAAASEASYGEWSDDDVVVLSWPVPETFDVDSDERARLYIVDEGTVPPFTWSPTEDWLRAPVKLSELEARRERLRRRVDASRPVELDEFGVARRGRRWVALSELEARIVAPLLARQGELVRRAALIDAAWGANDDRRLLDATMKRIRRRVQPLGVSIRTVRGVGYLLEIGELPEN